MAISKLFEGLSSAAAGAASGGATSGTGPTSHYGMAFSGRANGGDVTAGTPVWVGERGKRELFVPETNGTVIPEQKLGNQEPPQVNIIQVMSMDEALAAMRSVEGQKVILNTKQKGRL